MKASARQEKRCRSADTVCGNCLVLEILENSHLLCNLLEILFNFSLRTACGGPFFVVCDLQSQNGQKTFLITRLSLCRFNISLIHFFTTSLYSQRQTLQREIIEISQNVLAVKKLPSSTTNPCNTR